MKKKLLRMSLLSVFALLFGGAAFGALMSEGESEGGNDTSAEEDITAKWDFTSSADPRATAFYQGNSGTVASNVADINLTVNATSGKFDSTNRTGDVQINSGTIIKVPVRHAGDKVAIVGNYAVNYTIGTEEGVTDLNKTYEATTADATAKFVTITATGQTYFYSITVQQFASSDDTAGEDSEETAATDMTATWDYSNTGVMEETMALSSSATTGTVKAVEDNGILLTVEANGATFRNNGNNIQVRQGAVFKVPVKNTGDLVTIKGYPGYSYYKINDGDEIRNTNDNPTTEYKAKSSDVANGYVAITSTNDNNYFYSITVIQYAPKEATTLDNQAAAATFPFSLGTAGQKATFSNADYWIGSKVELGSNMGYAATRALGDVTFTKIQPQNTAAAAATDDYVLFRIQPKFGFTFTPTAVSLKAYKDGTDNGQLTIKWITSDGKETEIASGVGIQRNNEYSSLEYKDLSNVTPVEGYCGLKVYIGGNLTTSKQVGLSDIIIEGTLSGTEKEVPVLASFKINGTEYAVEDLFGDQYEADLKLSKKETMISKSNPLTDINVASGEVGTVTYDGTETTCKVTIPMTAGEVNLSYVLNITQKPDYTLTYYGVDGKALEKTQTIEEDSKIGEFIYDIADVKATQEGYKARGWFKNNYVGEKHSTDDKVTSDLSLYAVETEVEVASLSKKYEFDLTDKNFDPADHEAFNPTGGTPNTSDMRHGWHFKENDEIDLLVGPKANIIITTCMYPTNGTAKIVASNGKEIAAVSGTDGATQAIEYEGEGGTLTLTISGGQCYLHKIVIFNTSETNYEKDGQWIFVKEGDASSLLDAIDAANGTSGTDRVFIYLPNGTYDLKQTTLTTIGRDNISIIGESMEGVVIKNRPVKEGIAITATLLNTAKNTYLQDLTLDCIAPYGTGDDTKSAERGVCLQDKGTKTIAKNVYLKGLQDTYYSNGNEGMTAYFETSKIEGTVDFICGSGSILFNECDLYVADRSQSKTSANVITAPATYASEKGYAFYGCAIDGTDNQKGKYNLGRPWQKSPAATYINTTMKANASAAGWTSMNKAEAIRFHEFNTTDANGTVITTHNINACEASGTKDALYLTEEQTADYLPAKFFTDWAPATATAQLEAPEATLKDGTITWTAVEGATGYAIYADDELLAVVGADVTSYIIESTEAAAARRAGETEPVYTIRVANQRGGFGEPRTISIVTGIQGITANEVDGQVVYDLQGHRVEKATKGVFIINGKKVIMK